MKLRASIKEFSTPNKRGMDTLDFTVDVGPFSATGELVAGFWLWEVRDMDEALEWVKRCPNPMPGPCEIEIRPLYEMEDFGDAIPPGSRSRKNGCVGDRVPHPRYQLITVERSRYALDHQV